MTQCHQSAHQVVQQAYRVFHCLQVPIERNVSTIVFAPETAAVNRDFRVFVQTSSDGLLIGNVPDEILILPLLKIEF